MNDLKKRTAPKCASCGQYSTHENLIAVKTDDERCPHLYQLRERQG